MVVYKFGGALGRSRRGLDALVKIVREAARRETTRMHRSKRSGEIHGVVLVASAIGHTTRHLARAAELAEDGRLEEAEELLGRAVAQHEQLAISLGLGEDDLFEELESILRDVASLLEGITIVREVSQRTRDAVLACGERFAIALIEALLTYHDLPVRTVDAKEVIVTDENFGYAAPITEEVSKAVHKVIVPQLKRGHIVLLQGFVGATRDGITTTMGSESSDLTATLVASVLRAEEVVIWKTLPGLYTADPELVKSPKLIKSLSFEEAEEMGRRGARVLFPAFAHPLTQDEHETIVRIATPFGKSSHHTVLQREPPRSTGTRSGLALAIEQRLIPIVVRESGRSAGAGAHQREARAQKALARAAMTWRSQSETHALIRREDRRSIVRDLTAGGYSITESAPQSALSLILRKRSTEDDGSTLSAITRSLRSFPIQAIVPAGRSLITLVNDSEGLSALRKLHHDLFET